ncbi:MAG TPA: nucleotidyltransferase family protein [Acidimicrobiales bacterium]
MQAVSRVPAVHYGGVGANESTALLLWEACRREPRSHVVSGLIDSGADLGIAVPASVDHRIAPLLWRALESANRVDSLGADTGALRAIYDTYRMEAMLLIPRAVALAVEPLTAGGLEPVIMKGPAIAARYPLPGLRPMEDIDLFLPLRDHEAALALLGQAGWAVERPASHDDYDSRLVHREVPSLALELHYGLEHPTQRVTALDGEELWRRRQPITCNGVDAFGLSIYDEVTYLSAHAGKPHHAFFRLIWIADLAAVIGHYVEHEEAMDWDGLRTLARSAGCSTLLSAALALARHAGVDSPADLFPLPKNGWRGSAIRQLTDVSWPLTHHTLPGYHLNYALADTPRGRIRILLVLRASGHGIGRRLWSVLDVPRLIRGRLQRRASS